MATSDRVDARYLFPSLDGRFEDTPADLEWLVGGALMCVAAPIGLLAAVAEPRAGPGLRPAARRRFFWQAAFEFERANGAATSVRHCLTRDLLDCLWLASGFAWLTPAARVRKQHLQAGRHEFRGCRCPR